MRMNNSKKKTKQVIQQETKYTVSHNGEQFKEQTRRLIREESYELKQREARECNIIISNKSGEEEASDEVDGSSDTDNVVQRATDHEKVAEMIHKILRHENVEIMEVKRLPKPDDGEKPQLVWMKFGSRIQRNQVIKYKTKLKSSRWSNVFVTTDMTNNERHEDYTQYTMLKIQNLPGVL